MRLNTVKVLGISITTNSRNQILEEIRKYIKKLSAVSYQSKEKGKKPLVIVTPNPEQVMLAQTDSRLARIINEADIAIPDGEGLVWATKLIKGKSPAEEMPPDFQRIPGVELMEDIVRISTQNACAIGLIGGRADLAVRALECLQARYHGLKGWAQSAPDFSIADSKLRVTRGSVAGYTDELAHRIQQAKTGVVFVGLGAPKQEFLVEEISRRLSVMGYQLPLVLMTVGGSFDLVAGRLPRAPQLWRWAKLEWLWRLLNQPSRWHRQLALLRFLSLVFAEKLKV